MIDVTPELIAILGTAVVGGIGFGATELRARNNRERIDGINKELDAHVIHTHVVHLEVVDRLARIETKLDTVLRNGKDHARSDN